MNDDYKIEFNEIKTNDGKKIGLDLLEIYKNNVLITSPIIKQQEIKKIINDKSRLNKFPEIKTKRCHYIPQAYIKKWNTNNENKKMVNSIKYDDPEIKEVSTKEVFYRDLLYHLFDSKGNYYYFEDGVIQILEESLSNLESCFYTHKNKIALKKGKEGEIYIAIAYVLFFNPFYNELDGCFVDELIASMKEAKDLANGNNINEVKAMFTQIACIVVSFLVDKRRGEKFIKDEEKYGSKNVLGRMRSFLYNKNHEIHAVYFKGGFSLLTHKPLYIKDDFIMLPATPEILIFIRRKRYKHKNMIKDAVIKYINHINNLEKEVINNKVKLDSPDNNVIVKIKKDNEC